MTKQKESSFNRSIDYFQKIIRDSGPIAAASYGLVGAVILFILFGYFLDKWLDTTPWLMITGLLIGLGSGFYELSKVIWRK
ncbi:MAG: AtpZ/AtpI family protein [Candidatus Marinimicrobia bacterium]|jgi:F0F1-type ATP synthase assembly protein I|nr:AtpZ/AtpI family protein [Candidatus Neomarinimicrobiota bacterium]|tara:strand:- start:517 stop:759 length:243 start_codon:yes stop_codon:yes gene_type:complete